MSSGPIDNEFSVSCETFELEDTNTSRKRKRRAADNSFRRVIKNDVRKRIPIMFLHYLNQLDVNLMISFFKVLAVPTCTHIDSHYSHPAVVGIPGLSWNYSGNGIDAIISRLKHRYSAMEDKIPDFFASLRWLNIKQNKSWSRGHSEIQVGATFQGTKILEYTSPEKNAEGMNGHFQALGKVTQPLPGI